MKKIFLISFACVLIGCIGFLNDVNAEISSEWVITKDGGKLIGTPPDSYVGYNYVVQDGELKTLECYDPGFEHCKFMSVPQGLSYTNHINHMIQYAENETVI